MKDNIIDKNNPVKSNGKDKDWFDELCKKYNTENHWKKEKPKKKKSK